MIKSRINKKKTSVNFILKFISILLFIIVFFVIFYEFYQSNLINKKLSYFIEFFSQNYEYSLKKIKINELKYIEPSEIEKFFTEYQDKSIFLIPIKEISKQLHQNKWVEAVSIKSDYNNTISIVISESQPLGIFYNGENYFLFDNNLEVIDLVNLKTDLYSDLIKFIGNNSLSKANLLLKSIPLFFKNEIEEAIFINNRRWDVKLKNGIKLKLRENKVLESFDNYDKIYMNLSSKELQEIELIDLRLAKKAILRFKEFKND